MANIQIGNSSGVVPVKKNLFKDLGNVGLNLLASPIEGITGKNFFDPKMTTGLGKTLKGVGDVAGNITGAVAPAALNIVAPGLGTAVSTIGQGIGKALPGNSMVGTELGNGISSLVGSNPDMTDKIKGMFRKGGYLNYKRSIANHYAKGGSILPDYLHMDRETYNKYATGGSLKMTPALKAPTANLVNTTEVAGQTGADLTRYNGPKHENGGIPISQTDEVEGGETSFKSPKDGTFIFSDSIPMPNKNKTFAQESKTIDNKYAKRTGDVWSDNSKKMELAKLAELQEQVKAVTNNDITMAPDGSVHKMGGMMPTTKVNGRSRYNLSKKMMNLHAVGGPFNTEDFVKNVIGEKAYNLNNLSGTFSLTPPISPMTPKNPSMIPSKKTSPQGNTLKPQSVVTRAVDNTPEGYRTNNTIPLTGYAAQALTNLPMLLSKPSKAKYDRITPEKVDLTAQRLEAQGIRDKSLAVARRNASMLGSASAVNAYTGAVTSDIYGKYGDAYNNSLMNEKVNNAQIGNTANAQNAQIQMAEVEANQREQDSVRAAKQQSLFNIGQSAAGVGKAIQDSKQQDNMMSWLNMSNPDYGGKYVNGVYVPYRKKEPITNKYGGKLRGGKK